LEASFAVTCERACDPAVRAVALTVVVRAGGTTGPLRRPVLSPVARAAPSSAALHGPVRLAFALGTRVRHHPPPVVPWRWRWRQGVGARVGARSAARLPSPAPRRTRKKKRGASAASLERSYAAPTGERAPLQPLQRADQVRRRDHRVRTRRMHADGYLAMALCWSNVRTERGCLPLDRRSIIGNDW
jgi:hypothetical protein